MIDETSDTEAYLRKASASIASARAGTSPPAVESTLLRISDEVMDEALARREREARAIKPA